MRNRELKKSGKAGMAVACTACCALPMLILTGVVSGAAALAGGVAIGSVLAVSMTTFVVVTRRIRDTRPAVRWALSGSGAALALAGLLGPFASTGRPSPSLLIVGLAALAAAALLTLAASFATSALVVATD